jgi:hypothetical protein
MFDQTTAFDPEHAAAYDSELNLGYGGCNRCISEGSPHPCPAFVGSGTICQRNWCAHNWADHG